MEKYRTHTTDFYLRFARLHSVVICKHKSALTAFSQLVVEFCQESIARASDDFRTKITNRFDGIRVLVWFLNVNTNVMGKVRERVQSFD